MHELIVQICFVVAGVVTGCTDGHMQTNDPYLTSQDIPPVYVYDAPQRVSDSYHTSYTPSVVVGSLRLSWPTYTNHHTSWPSCMHAYNHYHGSHWYTWKTRYKTWNKYNHHRKRTAKARHRSSGSSNVIIKPKSSSNKNRKYHHKNKAHKIPRSKAQKKNYRRNNSRHKLNIPPNLYKRNNKPGARKKHNRKRHKNNRQNRRRDRR